jgi:3-hydroxyisobutyrate dehydrogenase-like beta-hydroxyacid dehydrogenase
MRLGFIGTGRMGHPMARKLVEAGHEVRALARSQDKRAALAADGAHPVATAAEAGEGADAVLVCVFTDEQVQEACLASGLLDAMPEGAVLVIHTTGSPRTAEDIAARAAPFGISVIDAPVSGGPHDIAAARLTLFAGGTAAALEQVRPALASYADPILHVGPLGAGQWVKLINNALFAAQLGLLASAVDLAAQLGVDESVLLHALPHGSAASRALTAVASRGSVTAFAETVADFLTKDVEVARDTAAVLGATLGPLDQAIALLTAAGGSPPAAT